MEDWRKWVEWSIWMDLFPGVSRKVRDCTRTKETSRWESIILRVCRIIWADGIVDWERAWAVFDENWKEMDRNNRRDLKLTIVAMAWTWRSRRKRRMGQVRSH
jgi:hypothetical protein